MTDKSQASNTQAAPGGPRKRGSFHHVLRGQAVYAAPSGQSIVLPTSAPPTIDHVVAPGGYRHKSQIHRVEKGQHIEKFNGRVRVVDAIGRSASEARVMTATPEILASFGAGWIAFAYWRNQTGSPITSFRTSWQVPARPTSDTGQTIFLFNAIEDAQMNDILQPVLQWGPSGAGGGSFWSIASWYINPAGEAFHTDPVVVAEGTVLVGVMVLLDQRDGVFTYESFFDGVPSTALRVNGIAELVWASETLEAYNVTQCVDYPSSASSTLDQIAMQTAGGNAPLSWTPVVTVGDCGQRVDVIDQSSTSGRIDIRY